MLGALGRRDTDRLIELSHPDVEWHSFFASFGDQGVFRGHDGTRRYMAELDEALEAGYAEVDDGLACGQLAVFVGRIHYRGRESHLERPRRRGGYSSSATASSPASRRSASRSAFSKA